MQNQKYDWREIGYTQGIRVCTQAGGETFLYPTLDQFDLEDEREFIAGYRQAQADYLHSDNAPMPIGGKIFRVFC